MFLGIAFAQTVTIPSGDSAAGEGVFRRICMACHIATRTGPTRLGPTLFGVVGRRAGSIEGFRYSQANRNSDATWTPEVLFQYLQNPRQFIPGTTMAFAGIRDEQERANVIAYLETLK
jgi:cytochrome c